MQALELQPLELIIPGAYYDSQIYDGRLYLWKTDSSIITLDWNKIIESIRVSEPLQVALTLGFQYGDDLYDNLLFKDVEIKSLISEKFKSLSKKTIELSKTNLNNSIISQQNNPLPFPHADSSIHYKTVFVGSQSGVWSSRCSYSNRSSLDSNSIKLWDGPVLSLSASHKTLALAAGSEGLFDYSLVESSEQDRSQPRCIAEEHSNFARWLYPGIFSSSYFNEGYFADFKLIKNSKSDKTKGQINSSEKEDKKFIQLSLLDEATITNISSIERDEGRKNRKINREFKKLFSSNEIFKSHVNNKSPIFTWGSQDKICLVTEDSIELVRCLPREKKETRKFVSLGSVESEYLPEDIVSADSSFFGIVLEEEDSLLVISSLLEPKRFPGEPVNWRVFPKSRNYTNQLHIIYEESLHIYSFNHDYFVDQETKKIGLSFRTN